MAAQSHQRKFSETPNAANAAFMINNKASNANKLAGLVAAG
jgi:hypothetical protein